MNESRSNWVMHRLSWPQDLEKLEIFLGQVNGWMLRPLSGRVTLSAFAGKILNHGRVVLALDDKAVGRGVVAFYCNDEVQREGFITLLSVHPEFRGRGLGKDLLECALNEMRAHGMGRVRLEVAGDNHSAIKLYLSGGFHELRTGVAGANFTGCIFMGRPLDAAAPA